MSLTADQRQRLSKLLERTSSQSQQGGRRSEEVRRRSGGGQEEPTSSRPIGREGVGGYPFLQEVEA